MAGGNANWRIVEAVVPDNQTIRAAALSRIAQVFKLPTSSLKEEMRFGDDLKPTFVSDWKYSEFDQLLHDIRDVADAETLKALDAGTLVITTVGDFCDHVAHCYGTNPREVEAVLNVHLAKLR
jgi:hypothetical protein